MVVVRALMNHIVQKQVCTTDHSLLFSLLLDFVEVANALCSATSGSIITDHEG